jgi:hypothetical protein
MTFCGDDLYEWAANRIDRYLIYQPWAEHRLEWRKVNGGQTSGLERFPPGSDARRGQFFMMPSSNPDTIVKPIFALIRLFHCGAETTRGFRALRARVPLAGLLPVAALPRNEVYYNEFTSCPDAGGA